MARKTENTNAAAPGSMTPVPVDKIIPNPWNQRRPVDAEFQASIAENGILQPVLLRRHPTKSGQFEIVCGERRWEAAKKAGLVAVPAIVREMTEDAARLHTFIENHHRAGMTVWQEAELLAQAAKREGFSVKAAAAALGWSETHVRRRMKLTELTPKWKKRIVNGREENWTAEMAELVASYPKAVQDTLEDDVHHVRGIDDLRRQLGGLTHLLASASFDIKDPGLNPKAGACVACPFRTSACTDLFGDTKETTGPGDKCLNPSCWDKKVAAHIAAKAALLEKEHGKVLKVSAERWWKDGDVLGSGQYARVAKSTPGAVPAIVMDGKSAGSTTWVKKSSPGSSSRAAEKPKSPAALMKEKRGALEARRWVLVGQKVQEAIEESARDKLHLPPIETLAAACVAFGCQSHDDVMGDCWEWIQKLLGDEKKTHRHLLDVVCERLGTDIQAERNSRHGSDYQGLQTSIVGVCGLFKLDVDALKASADAEIPEPKSWAAQEAAVKKAPAKKGAATKAEKDLEEDEEGSDDDDE